MFLGSLYFQIDSSQSGITNRMGAIFNMMMVTFMGSVIAVCATFPDERPLFLREKANNMYDTTTYFFAKIFSEFPFQLIYPFLFSLLFYWLVGFPSDAVHFFTFVLITALMQNVGFSIGLFLGSAVSEADTARGLIPFAVIPFSLVCGLFIVASEIPAYLTWMRWVSPFKFAYEAYLVLVFLGISLYCDLDELVWSGSSYSCPVTSGTELLSSLGLYGDTLWYDCLYLLVLYCVFVCGAWSTLRWRKDKL
jgi:ABC-type multidrug transport system permease subunit